MAKARTVKQMSPIVRSFMSRRSTFLSNDGGTEDYYELDNGTEKKKKKTISKKKAAELMKKGIPSMFEGMFAPLQRFFAKTKRRTEKTKKTKK
jgi:hypothetical protein